MGDALKICPLCDRRIPAHLESRHHLTPKLKGGKNGPIAILHTICHSKIHSLFTEAELAKYFYSIELLREHDEIGKFVNWVKKRPIEYRDSNRKAKR